MRNFHLIFIYLLIPTFAIAQKNVVPATQIPSISLKLPEGSRQDKRFLSTLAAATLLETEVKDKNLKLGATEVYMLPPSSTSGFDENVLITELEKSGFQIIPTDDERIFWLVKKETAHLIYFLMDKEETSLFLAKSNIVPINQVEPFLSSPTNTPNIPPHIPPLPPARSRNK